MLKSETHSCEDARRALLAIARDNLKVIADEDVKSQYHELTHAWDSERLVQGTISELEPVLGSNLDRISREDGFRHFIIEYNDAEGYAGIMALFPQSVVPIRLWRTADRFYLCGNRLFTDPATSAASVAGSAASKSRLSKRNGRRLCGVLRTALLVVLGLVLWFIWTTAGLQTWAKALWSIVSLVVCVIAWIFAWAGTAEMRDCPKCGRTLRLKMERRFTGQAFSSKNIQHSFICGKCGFTKDAVYGEDFT